jgi:hypothetical protein
MALNINEMILDRVRSLTTHDLSTGELLFRLTSLEDPSLACTAEGEEVVDAIGSLITTIYRAKKATFSASNSLISLDLAASQYGAKKIAAGVTKDESGNVIAPTITDYAYEILTIKSQTTGEGDAAVTTYSVDTLQHAPNVDSVKYIYAIENNQIGTAYKAGSVASATEFVVDTDGKITLPTGLTSGKIYVEYTYESDSAMKVTNRASEFPKACSMVIYAYFKDVCNENKTYSGKIICPKAKLNPEQVELALTSTGKHAFEFQMMKDYCAEEGDDELFSIIISE